MARQLCKQPRHLRLLLAPLFLSFGLSLSGCSTLGFLWQAGRGQLTLANRARPIEDVVRDERTPPQIKQILSELPDVRDYSVKAELKPTSNYREYVEWEGDAVVWVVSACPELSFEPKTWGFPIVGQVPYLGWFKRSDAMDFAHSLKRDDPELDVDVRGARAYSTLGWFRDPLLSTMIPERGRTSRARAEVVDVLFHESVHATFYFNDQTAFNESLASFVAAKLTHAFLSEKAKTDAQARVSLNAYEQSHARGKELRAYLHAVVSRLETIYKNESLSKSKRLEQKVAIITEAEAWLKERGMAGVFSERLNNASLSQFRAYESGLEEFEALFVREGKDWVRFWSVIKKLEARDFKRDQDPEVGQALLSLMKRA